jgi:branched-chain amino acid transport system substrate-binding protein
VRPGGGELLTGIDSARLWGRHGGRDKGDIVKKRYLAFCVAILAIAIAGLLLASCGSSSSSSSSSSSGTSGQKVFKIGYSADLSGPYSSYDVPILKGVQFAIDEVNAAGGVNGMKLELLYKDNKNDKTLAIQEVQELINSGIQYLIGDTSDNVTPMARLAGAKQIPSDTGDGTAPNLPRDDGEWNFQYIMGDNLQGAAMANYVYSELGYKSAFILRSPDVAYSANLPLYFKDVFEQLGGKTVGMAVYKVEGGDFSAQVTKIQSASPKPDMIYTPMFMPDTPVFLKQLKAAGVAIPVVTSDGNDTPDILTAGPEALNGMILTTFGYPEPGTPLADFYAKYEAKTGKAPDTIIVANGYDIVYILKAALEKSGGKGGVALRDAIANLSGVKLSTTDNFVMDPTTRQAKREVCLLKLVGAKFTFVKYLPYPAFVPKPL